MKWYYFIPLIVFCMIVAFAFSYAMASLESDKNNFSGCDDLYEEGNCLLYQCKMNYSTTGEISNVMYSLYHNCIINNKCSDVKSEEVQK